MTLIRIRQRWRPSDYLLDELVRHDAGVGMDLEDIDLAGLDLAGINLTGATLNGASLRGANLRGATLDRACLSGVDARSADLTGASLRRVFLFDVDLGGARLADIDTDGSTVIQTRHLAARSDQAARMWLVGGLVRAANNDPPPNQKQETQWV